MPSGTRRGRVGAPIADGSLTVRGARLYASASVRGCSSRRTARTTGFRRRAARRAMRVPRNNGASPDPPAGCDLDDRHEFLRVSRRLRWPIPRLTSRSSPRGGRSVVAASGGSSPIGGGGVRLEALRRSFPRGTQQSCTGPATLSWSREESAGHRCHMVGSWEPTGRDQRIRGSEAPRWVPGSRGARGFIAPRPSGGFRHQPDEEEP
jgi:hypothetical protein